MSLLGGKSKNALEKPSQKMLQAEPPKRDCTNDTQNIAQEAAGGQGLKMNCQDQSCGPPGRPGAKKKSPIKKRRNSKKIKAPNGVDNRMPLTEANN